MLLRIHPENPQPRLINQVVECLKDGGVIIYPTDTIYGLGCDIKQAKAIEEKKLEDQRLTAESPLKKRQTFNENPIKKRKTLKNEASLTS